MSSYLGSAGNAGYGASSYGSGYYGESIEIFKKFVNDSSEANPSLCSAIVEAIAVVFEENV